MPNLLETLTALIPDNFTLDYPLEERPNLASYIDHTALKAQTSVAQIEKLCSEARVFNFASVCVNPTYISRCKDFLTGSDVKVCTVIGFPLGANTPEVKAFEAKQAVLLGADEVDMVVNVGALLDQNYRQVFEDIRAVVLAASSAKPKGAIVKVILETAYLDETAKRAGCIISQRAGANYVKTSTGFGPSGATVEDISLMRATVGPAMGVKASGGIRDRVTSEAMIAAGATRLGVSAGVEIVRGQTSTGTY